MQDLIAKAATLLEALPYVQRFSGETFVVKYGGSFMDSPDPAVRAGVARDIVFLEAVEINPVVVHGGGKAITRAMEKAGLKATFIQGHRIDLNRFEEHDIAGDALANGIIRGVHEGAAVFHDEGFATEFLNVRQRFQQRRGFSNEVLH